MTAGERGSSDEARVAARSRTGRRPSGTRTWTGSGLTPPPDFASFDLAPPLQHGGELRAELKEWCETWRGPLGYEIRDLRITSGGDVAFAHSLNRMRGTRKDGVEMDLWVRASVGLRKIDGRWKVAHEHVSVPFHMDGSFGAAVDLAP